MCLCYWIFFVCFAVFKLPGRLRSHLKYIHWVTANRSLGRTCPSCHTIFHDLDTFRKHCIEDHSMVSCKLCPRIFPSFKYLRNHQSLTHDRIKINKLTAVPFDKASATSNIEENAKVYKCPYCNFCKLITICI